MRYASPSKQLSPAWTFTLAFLSWLCVETALHYAARLGVIGTGVPWYLESVIELLAVDLVLLAYRPGLLLLSRWRLSLKDVRIAVGAGLFWVTVVALAHTHKQGFGPAFVVCIVIVVPILEEILMRGALLRSLLGRRRNWLMVAVVALVAAFLHEVFVTTFLAQCILGFVYLECGCSLGASIMCHMTMNAIICFEQLVLLK